TLADKITSADDKSSFIDQLKSLEERLDSFLETQAQLQQSVQQIRTKLVTALDWQFEGEDAARFNHVPLLQMRMLLNRARRRRDDESHRSPLYELVLQQRQRLEARYKTIIETLGDAWSRYNDLSKQLDQQGAQVMTCERQLYDIYTRSPAPA